MNGGMKIIAWIAYCVIIILKCSGQKSDVIDCRSNELVTSIFNDPIDLTLRGVIKMYENVTINEILSTTNNEFKLNYIDARLDSSTTNETKNLILYTTKHFENYAYQQTAARISLKINLGCGRGKQRVVIFFQPLKEGNYFSPTFSQRFYELFVPTPIFAGFDLTAFLEIAAKDNDLTNNQILFTSNDSLQHFISVGTKNATNGDKKTYFANLTLEKILLELPQPFEFEITATDNGAPPRSSKTTVMIRSDPNRSLPPKPKFTQTLFRGYINSDFNMESLRIRLVNGTYTSEVEFSISGVGIEGFHLQDNKNGSIDIIWTPKNVKRGDILKHKIWELEVNAVHKRLADVGSTNVIVELVDLENEFCFNSSLYEGNIDEMGELHIEPIIFNPIAYQLDMKFTIQSLYNFFHLTTQNFSIQLQLNNNFTWQAIDDDVRYIKLILQASWENLSALTNVIIKWPVTKNVTSRQMFQFEKSLYIGQLNETNDLELETIVLKTDVANIREINYNLTGNDSQLFVMMLLETRLKIKSNFINFPPEKEKLKCFYLLILKASYNDLETFATVVIKAPGNHKEIQTKVFLSPAVKGKLMINNASQQLSVESISVAKDLRYKFIELNFLLRGDHSLHFGVKKIWINRTIEIELKTPLSSTILDSKHLIYMTLEAFPFNDTLLIFIELPIRECTTSLPALPQFSSSNYIFTALTNETGILGVVDAFSKDNNSTIHYTLGVENDQLAQSLSMNPFTGVLTLYGTVEQGNYLFNITAENLETRERTVAKALLKVQQREECSKLFEGVTVEKTLMIVHVDEEKPNYGVFDMNVNENCSFYIEDMWPNDKEYVHVNNIFNILDAIPIDREDAIFENNPEPQIMVKLRLKCDRMNYQQNLTIDIDQSIVNRSSQITFSADIPCSPDVMWLCIMIDDINDNPPEFKISEGPIYLGYPSGNASLDVYPEYLTQIEAFDKDLGFNAKILFTMRDNRYFYIEPNSGKIYPKGDVLDKTEQTELIILATDQYGEGLISNTVVVVKGLSTDFYSLITLREYSAKTKQELENELSQETGYDINVLKISYVPHLIQQRSNVNQSLSCKAWIYAYNKHQLVTYREMHEKILLKNAENNIVFMEPYKEASLHSFSALQDNNNFCYLIATTLLSLISCSSLIFIIWRFCYKPTLPSKCDTKTSALIDSHNGNGHQNICVKCSHGSDNARDCIECNNRDNNHVKFSDLNENGIENESQ